jgi:hypothetical protein
VLSIGRRDRDDGENGSFPVSLVSPIVTHT